MKPRYYWAGKQGLEKVVKLVQEFYKNNNRSPRQPELDLLCSPISARFLKDKEWRDEGVIDMPTLFNYANMPMTNYRKIDNRDRSIQKAKKHIGKKYGSFLITGIADFIPSNKKATLQVYADCDCGNKNKIYKLTYILSGNTKTCGKCLLFSEDERLRSIKKRIYGQYKHEAKRRWRNHEFLISQEELIDLLTQPCRSCDEKPSLLRKYKSKYYKGNDSLLVNTVDRIDSTKGYIKGNVMTLCYDCNIMKNSFDLETVAKKATALGKLATKLLK